MRLEIEELSGMKIIKDYYNAAPDSIRASLAVLSDMEAAGFYVDRKALYEFGESLNADIGRLQQSIWQHAGHDFAGWNQKEALPLC